MLIISNNSISNSESNGRIHMDTVFKTVPNNLHNFYLRGNPDLDNVGYISISVKQALLSKIIFGLYKERFIKPDINDKTSFNKPANNKSKYALFHLLRNYCYSNNRYIIKHLSKYISDNHIDTIFIWGCNVPFLYQYGYKLAKLNNIKLITFTGEDYPLKDYNYLSNKPSIFFKCFRNILKKEATKAYRIASNNYYATEDLKDLYESNMDIKGGEVMMFTSREKPLPPLDPNKPVKRLLYGGKLNIDRTKSLLDIAKYIEKYPDVYIDVYGSASTECINMLKEQPNVYYKGVVSYYDLRQEIINSDLLLYVEGFSKEYIRDCRYGFSTKIADYIAFDRPFFAYGPIELSGIKWLTNKCFDFVALQTDEIHKIESLILSR